MKRASSMSDVKVNHITRDGNRVFVTQVPRPRRALARASLTGSAQTNGQFAVWDTYSRDAQAPLALCVVRRRRSSSVVV